MNFVQPIRDPECIFYIKRFLKRAKYEELHAICDRH